MDACIEAGFYGCIGHSEDAEVSEQLLSNLEKFRHAFHPFADLKRDLVKSFGRLTGEGCCLAEGYLDGDVPGCVLADWIQENGLPVSDADLAFLRTDEHNIQLVHSGTIPEYSVLGLRLMEKMPGLSITNESQLLLALYMRGGKGLDGLKKLYSHLNYSQYAGAMLEEGNGHVTLTVFMDNDNPNLYVIDLRKTLGQVFFCASPEMWRSAVCGIPDKYIPSDQVMIEMPTLQIWRLKFTPDDADPWNIRKYKITKTVYVDYKEGTEDDV